MLVPMLCLLAVAPASEARKHLDAAEKRIRSSDFPGALSELAKAKKLSKRGEDSLEILIDTGVVKASTNKDDEAKTAFREALALDANAQLPAWASTRAQTLFEELKVKPAHDLPMPPPPTVAPPAPVVTAPVPEPAKPVVSPSPIPEPSSKEKPRLVVLELGAAGGVPQEVAGAMTETVTAEVAGRGFFAVVGAKEVQTLLGVERQRELLGQGCEEGACLNQVGGALGARFVMSGTVTALGTAYQLNIQTLDTQKSQPLGRSTRIAKNLESLRAQIPYAVAEACGTPLPPPPSRRLPYGLIAGGIALIAGGGLAGFDGLAQDRVVNSEFSASPTNRSVLKPYTSYAQQAQFIGTEKTLALAGLIVGAGLIGAGVYLNPPDVVSGAGVRLSLVPSDRGFALAGVFP